MKDMEYVEVEADKVATYMRDEYIGREFFGKGQKSLGTMVGVHRSKYMDARGFQRVGGVVFDLQRTDGSYDSRDYRPNDRVRFSH